MRTFITIFAVATLLAGTERRVTAPGSAFADFQARVEDYLKVHKEAEKQVPKLKDKAEPEQISAHERALAAAIQAARTDAKRGDIFTATSEPAFRAALKTTMKGPGKAQTRKAVKDENPAGKGEDVHLNVNVPYPKDARLSTVPTPILMRLPKLPEDLEYRFVGRTLILHDRDANLIVDYLPEATPAL